MPRLAKLRSRVIIQIQRREEDDQGGSKHLWDTYAERWAEVRPLGGSERMVLGATRADLTHMVTLRYDEGIPADVRIIHRLATNRRILKSISQPEDVEGAHVYTKIMCADQGEYTEAGE